MKKLALFFILLSALRGYGQDVPAIYADTTDHWLVRRAATLLQDDIERVTGKRPPLLGSLPSAPLPQLIIVGSLDSCPLVQQLAKAHRIPADRIKGKWESFLLKTIQHPWPNVKQALIIAGSDRRATAYGVFDLSRTIGVSPWYWWADVPVTHRDRISFDHLDTIVAAPAVRYRGFFINDEAPALSGWVHAKYGNFNHLFYEKVFELLLRLKANYLWPAMWGNAFNDDDTLNPILADRYGIVMGTSHHEPMLRAQQEWKRYGKGPWDYSANAGVLDSFWRKGIEHMDHHESIVTIGMRGDGDKPMEEGSNIALLEKIVARQRAIIADVTGKDPSATPQSWALYKEVQDYYDKGMRVPDDVTLLLCDDNWGNVRKLPMPGEKPRAGGYGLYYHFDYVGGPRNYKWINTNPIARAWEQLHLTRQYGVDRIWIVNVGDIKPLEFPTQFFLDYAWAPDQWPAQKLTTYTRQWAAQQFGPHYAPAIADIISTYTKYNGRRKPELLSPDTYSLFSYDEARRVATAYSRLARQTDSIGHLLPAACQDAWYELVAYPVLASANLNELYFTVATNRYYATQGRTATNTLAQRAQQLYEKDSSLARFYNTALAGGKWPHMMDQTHIGYTYWQEPRHNRMPEVKTLDIPSSSDTAWGLALDNSPAWWPRDLANPVLSFDPLARRERYIEVFNRTSSPLDYTIRCDAPWVRIKEDRPEERIYLSIDWSKAPAGTSSHATIVVTGPDKRSVRIPVTINRKMYPARTFIETDGCVAIEAAHYSRHTEASGVSWLTIPDLGRTLSGVQAAPVTAPSLGPGGNSPRLEYDVYLSDTGTMTVQAWFSPILQFNRKAIRYGISFDSEQPQLVDITAGNETHGSWDKMVADNIRIAKTLHHITRPGRHILKYWFADPTPVLQRLVIDAGGLKNSYLGPPESPTQD
ncbi:MAG: glycosyl hydrolase 115 family protein [Bacteroidetes bacterium]|nr:glycosyl hydrolase 115 family protein [Bacteroidota bacterium]